MKWFQLIQVPMGHVRLVYFFSFFSELNYNKSPKNMKNFVESCIYFARAA